MDKPSMIITLENQLRELIGRDDKPYIPVKDVSKFLGMDTATLLAINMNHDCPFGMGSKPDGKSHGYANINKLKLWNYFMSGAA